MKRSRTLYVLLFLSALVYIYFYGGKIPYMFFYAIAALPLFSLAYTAVIFLRFKYIQKIDKDLIVKGDKVHFIFKVTNDDPLFYPYIKVAFYGACAIFDSQFQERSFSLQPFQGKTFSIQLQCNYRGSYEVGLKGVEIEDFLGIFKLKYKIPVPKHVTVYPRIVHLDKFSLESDFVSESHMVIDNRIEDMATVADIRQYTPGDSLKRIHWKLTAKSQDIMVKKFQSTSQTSIVMLLDLKANPYADMENMILEDKLIECVVSVLHYCLHHWIPTRLIYFSGSVESVEARDYLLFDQIYQLLAGIKFAGSVSLKDLLEVYTAEAPAKTNILTFTSNLDYDLYDQIYKTSQSGYDVSLIYVSAEKLTGIKEPGVENILESLPEIGVKTYKVGIEDDIRPILEN